MNAVCKERMPLHASSTLTHWLATWIRLPTAIAGVPHHVSTSAQIEAFPRINSWTI